MDQQTPNQPIQTPVNRERRFYFVLSLVSFCFLIALGLIFAVEIGYLSIALHLVTLYIEGLLGTATAVALAYIGGSVVDYNGGIGNIFSRRPNSRVAIRLPEPIDDTGNSGARG